MTGAKDIHICYVFIYVSIIIYLFLYLSFYQYLSSFPYLHVSLSIHFRLNLSNPCLFFLSTYTYIYTTISVYITWLYLVSFISISFHFHVSISPFQVLFVCIYIRRSTFLYHSVFTYLCLYLRMFPCLCIFPIQLMEIIDRSSTQFLIVQELDFFIRGLAFGELNNTRIKTGGKTNFNTRIHK